MTEESTDASEGFDEVTAEVAQEAKAAGIDLAGLGMKAPEPPPSEDSAPDVPSETTEEKDAEPPADGPEAEAKDAEPQEQPDDTTGPELLTREQVETEFSTRLVASEREWQGRKDKEIHAERMAREQRERDAQDAQERERILTLPPETAGKEIQENLRKAAEPDAAAIAHKAVGEVYSTEVIAPIRAFDAFSELSDEDFGRTLGEVPRDPNAPAASIISWALQGAVEHGRQMERTAAEARRTDAAAKAVKTQERPADSGDREAAPAGTTTRKGLAEMTAEQIAELPEEQVDTALIPV